MRFLAVLIAAITLAACTTVDVDTAIRRALPDTCKAADVLYAAYIANEPVPSPKITAARAALDPICANQATATAADLAIAVAQYAIIIKVVKDSK